MAADPVKFKSFRKLLQAADYARLSLALRDADLRALAGAWARFAPLEKLVLFKLLDPPRALEFYARLAFRDRYDLLCGFPLNSIAPVLEDLPPAQRRPFKQLPRECYDRMFRLLASERIEMDVTVSAN